MNLKKGKLTSRLGENSEGFLEKVMLGLSLKTSGEQVKSIRDSGINPNKGFQAGEEEGQWLEMGGRFDWGEGT